MITAINGLVFGDIPDEMSEGSYDYAIILKNLIAEIPDDATGEEIAEAAIYHLFTSKSPFYYANHRTAYAVEWGLCSGLFSPTAGFRENGTSSNNEYAWTYTFTSSKNFKQYLGYVGTVSEHETLYQSGTFEVVWANHDIHECTGLDDSGNPILGDIYFRKTDVELESEYSTDGTWFANVASQARRLSDSKNRLTVNKVLSALATVPNKGMATAMTVGDFVDGECVIPNVKLANLVAGRKYRVKIEGFCDWYFDAIALENVTSIGGDSLGSGVMIGNEAIMVETGLETGEPFALFVGDNVTYIYSELFVDDVFTFTISVMPSEPA